MADNQIPETEVLATAIGQATLAKLVNRAVHNYLNKDTGLKYKNITDTIRKRIEAQVAEALSTESIKAMIASEVFRQLDIATDYGRDKSLQKIIEEGVAELKFVIKRDIASYARLLVARSAITITTNDQNKE